MYSVGTEEDDLPQVITPWDIADRAHAVIERRGWWGGSPPWDSIANQVCILQALSIAVYELLALGYRTDEVQSVRHSAETQLAGAARIYAGQGLANWNDKVGRTKDDVLRLLETVE